MPDKLENLFLLFRKNAMVRVDFLFHRSIWVHVCWTFLQWEIPLILSLRLYEVFNNSSGSYSRDREKDRGRRLDTDKVVFINI